MVYNVVDPAVHSSGKFLAAEDRIKFQVRLCDFCGWKIGTRVFLTPPSQLFDFLLSVIASIFHTRQLNDEM
jgi:hypothetical protein